MLHDAIKAAKGRTDPIELLVENTDYYKTFKLDYHEGENILAWFVTKASPI